MRRSDRGAVSAAEASPAAGGRSERRRPQATTTGGDPGRSALSAATCFLCANEDAPRHVCKSCVVRALDALGKLPERPAARARTRRREPVKLAEDVAPADSAATLAALSITVVDALTDEEWAAVLVAEFRQAKGVT